MTLADEKILRLMVQNYLTTRSGATTHEGFVEHVDKLLVAEALRRTGGNQTQAAKLLGLTRPTVQAKMNKHGLRREVNLRGE